MKITEGEKKDQTNNQASNLYEIEQKNLSNTRNNDDADDNNNDLAFFVFFYHHRNHHPPPTSQTVLNCFW